MVNEAAIARPTTAFMRKRAMKLTASRPTKGMAIKRGPEGESLKRQYVERAAQECLPHGSRPAQSEQCRQIPAQQQRTQATLRGSAHENEGNGQDHRSHGDDPEIDSAHRMQNVVVARSVRNWHLGDRDSSTAPANTVTRTTATPMIAITANTTARTRTPPTEACSSSTSETFRSRIARTVPEWRTARHQTTA